MSVKEGKSEGISGNQGFTLIEMAIVLIIIGIIIGAVVKGKDLVRGAEQKKIYAKFINEWRIGYLNFYDRTGMVLGDTNVPKDGHSNNTSCTNIINGSGGTPPAYYGMLQVGLKAPTTNSSDECTYRYTDSEGGMHDIGISFAYGTDAQTGTAGYNYMALANLPIELAIALDRMIDSEADGTNGDFIRVTGNNRIAWIRSPSDTPTTETQVARWKMEF